MNHPNAIPRSDLTFSARDTGEPRGTESHDVPMRQCAGHAPCRCESDATEPWAILWPGVPM